MRKGIIAAVAAAAVVGGIGGWAAWRHFRRDPVSVAQDYMVKGDLRSAELLLRDTVRRDPANAKAHFRLGEVQLEIGDAVAAEKELKAARAEGIGDARVVPPLALSYLGQERFRDLLRDFPPQGLPPQPLAALLVNRSLAQLALHDGAAARASATAAERLAPNMAEAALANARIAAALNDPGQALQMADRALRLNPKLVEALGLKADILRGQGDLAQALVALDAAVADLPDAPRVLLARARTRLAAGDDAGARRDVTAALQLDPRNTLGNYLQAVLLIRAKDWPKADVSLEQIQPVLGKLPRGEYYYALVKANVNQKEVAAEAAGRYVARSPSDPDGFRLLARIDLALGQQAAATAALQKVAALGGEIGNTPPAGADLQVKSDLPDSEALTLDSPEALTRLAAQQLDAGDTGAATRDLERSLEAAPKRIDSDAIQVIAGLTVGDVGRAAAALDKLRQKPDASPAVVGNLTGLVRLAQLDYPAARAAWQDAVAKSPDAVPLRVNLARVMALQGDYAAAERQLQQMLASQPASRLALRALVEIRLAQGHVQEALAAVQAARKAAPALIGLLVTEAVLRARAGDFAGAYNTLDEVPLEQAQSPLLLNTRAQILLTQGRGKEAADAYRQLLFDNAGDLVTRQRLIRLLTALNQAPEALRLARDGLAQAPGNSGLLEDVALLTWRTGGLEPALAMADAARRDPINLPTARLLKGNIYMAAKRYDDAAAAYAAELRDAPFSALAIVDAAALRAAGHTDQALALLRAWVAKQDDPTVSEALAGLDIEARQLDDAADNLNRVLAVRPSDPVALNNLAWIEQQKQPSGTQARALAEKAYLLAPSPQTSDTLGWILTQQGDAAKGLLLLRRAAALLRNDPTVLYHLAAALQASGKHDEAATAVAAALARPAAFDEKPQALRLQQELAAAK